MAIIGRRHAEELARTHARVSIELAREGHRASAFVRAVLLMQKTAAVYAVEGDEGEQLADAPPQSEIQGVSAEIAAYAEPEMQETFARWMLTCVNLVTSVHLNGRIEVNRGTVREVIALQAKFTRQVNAALSREIVPSGRDLDRKKGHG